MRKLFILLVLIVSAVMFLPTINSVMVSAASVSSDTPYMAVMPVSAVQAFVASVLLFSLITLFLSRRSIKPEGVFAVRTKTETALKAMVAKFEVGWRNLKPNY